MAKVSRVLRSVEGGFSFWCPGCQERHWVRTSEGMHQRWWFDGNLDAPTFSPSILVRCGHYVPEFKHGDACWCTHNAELVAEGREPTRYKCGVCHSFVRAGMIEFLTDCTHELAGKTVPLPDVD